jgi:hypothetical protein
VDRRDRRSKKRLRSWAASRRHFALSTAVASRVISLAGVLGRPVRNAAGTQIGRVSDIIVRRDVGGKYPSVTGVLVCLRSAFAFVQHADATLTQTEVRLGSIARVMWRPEWRDDDVSPARDVLIAGLWIHPVFASGRQPMCISSRVRKAGSWRVSTWASGLVAEDS